MLLPNVLTRKLRDSVINQISHLRCSATRKTSTSVAAISFEGAHVTPTFMKFTLILLI